MFAPELSEAWSVRIQVEIEPTPLVFCETEGPLVLDWIARGTDGDLYIAPAVAGGWLQRKRYDGPLDKLVPICGEKARAIAWYLYGDLGDVAIASEPVPTEEGREQEQARWQWHSLDYE